VSYRLEVESWSNSSNKVNISGITEDGRAISERNLQTASGRAKNTHKFPLPDNLRYLEIVPDSIAVRRGNIYIRAFLSLGGKRIRTLCSGYISPGRPLTIGNHEDMEQAPGRYNVSTGANPAAGAEVSVTIASNQLVRLVSVKIQLVADATVVNRLVQLIVTDSAKNVFRVTALTNQTAGQTITYYFSIGVDRDENGNTWVIPLPEDIFAGIAWTIETVTTNLQAGDDYAAPVLVYEEWIQE